MKLEHKCSSKVYRGGLKTAKKLTKTQHYNFPGTENKMKIKRNSVRAEICVFGLRRERLRGSSNILSSRF